MRKVWAKGDINWANLSALTLKRLNKMLLLSLHTLPSLTLHLFCSLAVAVDISFFVDFFFWVFFFEILLVFCLFLPIGITPKEADVSCYHGNLSICVQASKAAVGFATFPYRLLQQLVPMRQVMWSRSGEVPDLGRCSIRVLHLWVTPPHSLLSC